MGPGSDKRGTYAVAGRSARIVHVYTCRRRVTEAVVHGVTCAHQSADLSKEQIIRTSSVPHLAKCSNATYLSVQI